MQGAFIVFEGLDGAGTTTQAKRLVSALSEGGQQAMFTCEPSDRPIGALIRQALGRRFVQPTGERLEPASLALLFAADRIDHLSSEIRPAQANGSHVICDRYLLSSLAYQGQELEFEFVEQINSLAPPPDLTLFLQVSPETALKRRKARDASEELFETVEIQKRVERAYENALQQAGEAHRVVMIDAERSEEAVARQCWEAVEALLITRLQKL